jgi:hypothetical protein
MNTIVPFFRNVPDKFKENEIQSREKFFDYKKAIEYMHKTFTKFNSTPHKFIIQSDYSTYLDNKLAYRTHLDELNLMESFVVANIDFLQNNSGNIALLAADQLFCGNVDQIFSQDFDLATITYGNDYPPSGKFQPHHRTNIVNLFFVKMNDANRSLIIKFFLDRFSIYKSLPSDERLWWGDQSSVSRLLERELVLTEHFASRREKVSFNFGGIKLLLLPYGGDHVAAIGGRRNNWSEVPSQLKLKSSQVLIDFAGGEQIKKHFNSIAEALLNRLI